MFLEKCCLFEGLQSYHSRKHEHDILYIKGTLFGLNCRNYDEFPF